ncbi:MAG: MipA/OmpV family protein [Moraxellaceae bacterium]|nr:MipA/OmpV family protein [Moraxellaceae bacterium]
MYPNPAHGTAKMVRSARAVTLVALAAATIHAVPARAQHAPDEEGGSSWAIGLGFKSEQKPYAGMDRDNMPLPFLEYENKYILLRGPSLEVKLPGLTISESQQFKFGLVLNYSMDGYKAGDAPVLRGMAERKGGIWAGAKAEWETSLLTVTGEALRDVSGNSKGQTVALGVERTWHVGDKLMLTPRAVMKWQDGKYNNYYFGVKRNEAQAGRAAYDAGAGANAEFGVRAIYMFNQSHSMFMDVSTTSLSSKVKDSPLVDRSTENEIMMAYVYRF